MRNYKIENKAQFDYIRDTISTYCVVRDLTIDYLQTECGIHLKYIGKVDGIDYEVISVMANEYNFFNGLEVCENSIESHSFS